MKIKKRAKKQSLQLALWIIAAFLAMLTLATVLASVWYVHVMYEKYADETLYRTDAYVRSPQFFAFQFWRQNLNAVETITWVIS